MTVRPKRPRLALALALWLTLALVACTGTFEESAPVVLLVATGSDAGGSDAAIVAFLVEPPGPATPRSVTPLGGGDLASDIVYPIQDWDWRDRDGAASGPGAGRTQLTVLASRTSSEASARQARLHRYDVSAFDPASPALAPSAAAIDLVVDGVWATDVGEGVFAPDEGVCLSAVSISARGTYAALLDRRADCQAGASETALYLLDLSAAPPRLVWTSTPVDVAPARAPIDQARDELDVWLTRASGFDVYRASVDTLRGPLGGSEPLVSDDETRALRDVSVLPSAAGERWLLFDGQLRTLSDSGQLTPGVPSASGATRRLVPTDARLPVVVVGGTDLWVHPTPSSEALRLPRAYRDGATDVADRLTYLVRNGAIDTLDLLVFDPQQPLGASVAELYRDGASDARLSAPRLLTWFRPRAAPTP